MDEKIEAKFAQYLQQETHPYFLAEARSLADNPQELYERFVDDLAFGTGGLRGLIGTGSNRMNPYNVKKLSQGVANYALQCTTKPICAVVSFDSRHYSPDFAQEAALVFAACGIKTYLFPSVHPIALLSFAIRHYHALFGIMITASHNPPAYNGYKVYWQDGAQVLPPHDIGIMHSIAQTQTVHTIPLKEAKSRGLILTPNIDALYQDTIAQLLRPDIVQQQKQQFRIVYTSLHGSGLEPVRQALCANGFCCQTVPQQESLDGDFPTVKTPNPEDPAALNLAMAQAKQQQAHMVIGTDPDADRLGVAVLHHGEFVPLTGNQVGAILLKYLLDRRRDLGLSTEHCYFVNSTVSSGLHNAIAQAYGIRDYRVLTGFKYIAQLINTLETHSPAEQFLFGCEESYGYLCTTAVRDKDAVSSALVLAECALWHHSQGRTLVDALEAIYQEFGYYQERQINAAFPGAAGKTTIQKLMDHLRHTAQPFCSPVQTVKDYLLTKPLDAEQGPIALPSSNVLEFCLENGCVVIARPSGTEPKVKFYLLAKGQDKSLVQQAIADLKKDIETLLAQVA